MIRFLTCIACVTYSSYVYGRDNILLESLENIQKTLMEIESRSGVPCNLDEAFGANCDLFATGVVPNPPLETKDFGRITRYWAQTNAGTDLAWDHMQRLRSEGSSLSSVAVGACDGGFNLATLPRDRITQDLRSCTRETCPRMGAPMSHLSHGEGVTNLMAGVYPLSASPVTQLSSIVPGSSSQFSCEQILDAQPKPRFVNISLHLSKQPETFRSIARNSFVTYASGNGFPSEHSDPNFEGVSYVGSTTPSGLVSSFSQKSSSLLISSPSDNHGTSFDKDGNLVLFGGTSGAAPLASGSLANLEALLPGITNDEIRLIAERSAYQSAGFRPPRPGDGVGNLNSYLLVRVADRMRKEWPRNRADLQRVEIYNFSTEAGQAFKKFETMRAPPSCSERKRGFSELRKAFFLDPENRQVSNALADFYEREGYIAESHFYRKSPDREVLGSIVDPAERIAVGIRNGIPYDDHLESMKNASHEKRSILFYHILGTGEESFPALAALMEVEHAASRKKLWEFFDEKISVKGIKRSREGVQELRPHFKSYLAKTERLSLWDQTGN